MDDEMVDKLIRTANIMDDIILDDLGFIEYASRNKVMSGKGIKDMLKDCPEYEIGILTLDRFEQFLKDIIK